MISSSFSGQQPERMLADPRPVLYREVGRKPRRPRMVTGEDGELTLVLGQQKRRRGSYSISMKVFPVRDLAVLGARVSRLRLGWLVRWVGDARAAADGGIWQPDGESGDRSDS
jgi:hypothetical protein